MAASMWQRPGPGGKNAALVKTRLVALVVGIGRRRAAGYATEKVVW